MVNKKPKISFIKFANFHINKHHEQTKTNKTTLAKTILHRFNSQCHLYYSFLFNHASLLICN